MWGTKIIREFRGIVLQARTGIMNNLEDAGTPNVPVSQTGQTVSVLVCPGTALASTSHPHHTHIAHITHPNDENTPDLRPGCDPGFGNLNNTY